MLTNVQSIIIHKRQKSINIPGRVLFLEINSPSFSLEQMFLVSFLCVWRWDGRCKGIWMAGKAQQPGCSLDSLHFIALSTSPPIHSYFSYLSTLGLEPLSVSVQARTASISSSDFYAYHGLCIYIVSLVLHYNHIKFHLPIGKSVFLPPLHHF